MFHFCFTLISYLRLALNWLIGYSLAIYVSKHSYLLQKFKSVHKSVTTVVVSFCNVTFWKVLFVLIQVMFTLPQTLLEGGILDNKSGSILFVQQGLVPSTVWKNALMFLWQACFLPHVCARILITYHLSLMQRTYILCFNFFWCHLIINRNY